MERARSRGQRAKNQTFTSPPPMFMLCSQFGVPEPRRAVTSQAWNKVGAGGEKAARRFSGRQADARLRNYRNEAGLRPRGRGKKIISVGFTPCKALISLESTPEMEGNGKVWKALLRVRCAKMRFDCALMAPPGAFLKDNGFDFTESVDRRRGRHGNSPLLEPPWLASDDQAPLRRIQVDRSEGCMRRRASDRSDRLDHQAAMRKVGRHAAPIAAGEWKGRNVGWKCCCNALKRFDLGMEMQRGG